MKSLFFMMGAAGLLAFASCSKNGSSNNDQPTNGQAKVQMLLTDAPATYDAIFLDVKSVSINNSTGDAGWVNYPLDPRFNAPINILDYRNGTVVAMGDPLIIPAGKIEQIRLILGDNNKVVVDGVEHDLTIPSGSTSGYKINFHKELAPDGVYKIWLDFDAARSVHAAGKSGKYMLKPVVKAFSEETNGQFRGYVKPLEAKPWLYALKGTDTIGSAIPEADGFFHFVGLADGAYALHIDADSTSAYRDTTINNINVVFGKVTDMGTITLTK
ncbi:DUF4382 domain-containing protein [Niabella drilacis]|uniref:DUF4382 domain-containing protein n=1 Tax=Niabella drilacis (strain DSM 25811 / CCM 8410 / CCUG 62505 / LMG 26954 / E90) TaxID=1285928 RepID=A0A1G6LDR3_NIADE|nr:DUF4382 domain-containing protein [Niabella drilacis]SDC40736.1 protein of unknown function [Niabella drilacis]